jgi:hypothetical protein
MQVPVCSDEAGAGEDADPPAVPLESGWGLGTEVWVGHDEGYQ